MISESELYPPVKLFLEAEGYAVKSEVKGCDVVAEKPDAPTIIVELKISFSLELVLQGIDRQKLTDSVYLAVSSPDTAKKRRNFRKRQRSILNLCRRLGLGLMLIDLKRDDLRQVDVLVDPAPYRPRKNTRQQARLKKEFTARVGDPNVAGITKTKIVTAYRQNAIRCALVLADGETRRLSEIRAASGVTTAGAILQKNHYGWFERAVRGAYRLTGHGKTALEHYAEVVAELSREP